MLIHLGQLRIEVQVALPHSVEHHVALPQLRHEPSLVAAGSGVMRQIVVRDGQIPLPLGVRRVGLGQPLPDAERLAEKPLGLGQIPLLTRQIAELV